MPKELSSSLNTLKQINKLLDFLENNTPKNISEFISELIDSIQVLNEFIYGIDDPRFNNISMNIRSFLDAARTWSSEINDTINYLDQFYKKPDYDFYKLMLYIKTASEEQMLDNALSNLSEILSSLNTENKNTIIQNWNLYSHLWGPFDPHNGIFDHLTNGIHELKENHNKFISLYENLCDYRSKIVLFSIINYWLYLDNAILKTARENNYCSYFDHDLLNYFTNNETIVDCGAFDGDSAMDFFNNFSSCKKMYLYDMVPSNLSKAQKRLENYDNIIYRNAGVTSNDKEGTVINVADFSTPSYSLLYDNKNIIPNNSLNRFPVPLVTIDHDISEPISLIKMDIEGSELDALQGAEQHIKNDHPTLTICSYHHYDHMWKIPELILSYNPDYKLFMRFNGDIGSYIAGEYVLFAIPSSKNEPA